MCYCQTVDIQFSHWISRFQAGNTFAMFATNFAESRLAMLNVFLTDLDNDTTMWDEFLLK